MSLQDPSTGTWTQTKVTPPETVDVEKTWKDSFGDEISQFKLDGKIYSIESRCLQTLGLASDFRARIPLSRIRTPYLVFMGGYHRYPLTLSSQNQTYSVSDTVYTANVALGRDWMLLPFLFTRLIGSMSFGVGTASEVGNSGTYPPSHSLELGTRIRAGLGWLIWPHGMLALEGGGFANYSKFTVPGGYSLVRSAGTTYNAAFDVGWSASRFIRIEGGFVSEIKEPFYLLGVGFGI